MARKSAYFNNRNILITDFLVCYDVGAQLHELDMSLDHMCRSHISELDVVLIHKYRILNYVFGVFQMYRQIVQQHLGSKSFEYRSLAWASFWRANTQDVIRRHDSAQRLTSISVGSFANAANGPQRGAQLA
ncbi:hypothetical protein [Ferrimicrobium sp.]|uniref:hypothetical protein n=1 Tax=Ferrimicrobium sp. TaxID=2926050 RepID=UPI00260FDC89|nr:hypothetical protein [Ferrimicrobium sp.]